MQEKKIILISPRGFCAGVERAIVSVNIALNRFGVPVYVNHEIVHNRHVVSEFQNRGVVFEEDVDKIPAGAPFIISAHGASQDYIESAKRRGLQVIDASCPLVTRVHNAAKRFASEGYTILYIGHRNHAETIGTMAEAPGQMILLETVEDADSLDLPAEGKKVYLTQTTLSLADTAAILKRLQDKFPDMENPGASNICYATTNRQQAIEAVIAEIDMLIVVGSSNSSNSKRLYELGVRNGKESLLIDSGRDLKPEELENIRTVGITAGASAPEHIVSDLVDLLRNTFHFSVVQETEFVKEKTEFLLPAILRETGVK